MSRQELATAVNAYLWQRHQEEAHLDYTDVGKLERGVVRWPGEHRREAFRAVLGAGSDAELGLYQPRTFAGRFPEGLDDPSVDGAPGFGRVDHLAVAGGLAWAATPADSVAVVTGLWSADLRRRAVLGGGVWVAGALALPLGRWLLDPVDPAAAVSRAGGRRVGRADVDALWTMCTAFAAADHQLGGGYARNTMIHYADQVVAPLLEGTYREAVGRDLFAAVARLCNIIGFMCFDSGSEGPAQRYFIQSLRLAKASGQPALAAHILADMAMQAHHLRHAAEAVALAEAGVAAAVRGGSPSTLARCHAIHARTLALGQDPAASDRALLAAEQTLAKTTSGDEPTWTSFFTAQQLAAESMYVAAELDRVEQVRRHAAFALAADGRMQRRHVLATATLADTYLPTNGRARDSDVDHACHLLRQVLPLAGSLTSTRTSRRLDVLRHRLSRYPKRPGVQQLRHDLQAAAMAAGPR